MTPEEHAEYIRKKRIEKLMSIFDSNGRFRLSALLRIRELHVK